jgi:diacylglycerol kinase family enzyme
MKSQFVILGAIFALLLATSAVTFAVAVEPTNTTITPENSTVFLENGANISGTPSLMPSENISTSNLTVTNVTDDDTIRLPDLLKLD